MNFRFILFSSVLLALGCSSDTVSDEHSDSHRKVIVKTTRSIDFQGHRGCRGLLPENTVTGFIHALDLGVTTLEMDAVITADGQVLLSHEPWFSHEICTDPAGKPIDESNQRNHVIYAMTLEEVQSYDCGSSGHPKFSEQKPTPATKPSLAEVIKAAENHVVTTDRALPFYNIETKSTPQGDGILHPSPNQFAEILANAVTDLGVQRRTVIQSFDVRTLQYLHENHPEFKLALLVENGFSPAENLDSLGFTPHIYSPDHHLVDGSLVDFCQKANMELIPWTVNEIHDMEVLIEMGVDGLISDYPDRFAELNAYKKATPNGDSRK